MAWDPVRKWRMRRPLMLLAACLVSGMAVGYQNAAAWWLWAILLGVSAVIGLLCRRSAFFFAAALPFGAMIVTIALSRPAVFAQDDILLTGRIASEPVVKEEYTRVMLDDVHTGGEEIPSRVMLYLYGEEPVQLQYGAEISVPADTYLPSDRQNPYSDSYAAYLWQQGAALCASASAQELTVSARPSFSLAGWSVQCRLRLEAIVRSIYSEEIAPLVSALALGDRSMLPEELYESFKTAGLAHLLAISGLHISCLALMIDFVLRKLRFPGKITVFLVTGFLIAYASVIGFPASVCRAVLMYFFTAGARLAGRPSDGLTGLSMALMILLLINPLSIADISLILSFCSVGGLMIFTRLLTPRRIVRLPGKLRVFVRWVCDSLSASLSAQLGALPAVACVFGSFSSYSLLANLPAIPLLTLSLPAAMISLLAGSFSPAVGRIFAFPVEGLMNTLIAVTGRIAALPGAVIDTPVWPAALIYFYIAVCVLCSQVSNIRRRFKQLLICLLPLTAASALLLPMTFPTGGLEVLFLDAGQADAAVIRAEDRYYLMDAGEDGTMAGYLADSGIRPSGVFISHPHSDHAGGLQEVIELCPPGVIYVPCLWHAVEADEGVPEILSAAAAAGWSIKELAAGDVLTLSDHVSARVYQPFPGMTDDANGASLCMSVSIGDGSVLFTGDLPAEEERAFFPDCDVLKVAHHGAKSSTSRLLIDMTSPAAAVISVGHNSYGHPSEETIARLKEAGTAVYRTDECGAVSALLGADGLIQITPMNAATESEAAP